MKYQAFIFNHPDEVFDSIEGAFECEKKLPASALFFYKRKPTILLVHSNEKSETLVRVNGVMQFDVKGLKRKTTKYDINRNWYAMTLGAVEPQDEQKVYANKQKLLDDLNEGDFYDNPVNMGPYTLGSNLALPEVQRQMFKHKLARVADQLDSAVKWLIPTMIIALVLVVLTTRG